MSATSGSAISPVADTPAGSASRAVVMGLRARTGFTSPAPAAAMRGQILREATAGSQLIAHAGTVATTPDPAPRLRPGALPHPRPSARLSWARRSWYEAEGGRRTPGSFPRTPSRTHHVVPAGYGAAAHRPRRHGA